MRHGVINISGCLRAAAIILMAVAGVFTSQGSAADSAWIEIAADTIADKTGTELRAEQDGGRRASVLGSDTLAVAEVYDTFGDYDRWELSDKAFNPSPNRAVWLSALFPGLGQIYNRRYWKLPIVVGGFMGLGYATSWNNKMLTDYQRAYRDIMDSDPSTNSYMDFFPPTTSESDLDKTWLTKLLKSRKDFYRRNRDLCIIGMVGVYLLAMVDAYVDASLSHFDISPDLSMDVVPTLIQDGRSRLPSVGLSWAFNF